VAQQFRYALDPNLGVNQPASEGAAQVVRVYIN